MDGGRTKVDCHLSLKVKTELISSKSSGFFLQKANQKRKQTKIYIYSGELVVVSVQVTVAGLFAGGNCCWSPAASSSHQVLQENEAPLN